MSYHLCDEDGVYIGSLIPPKNERRSIHSLYRDFLRSPGTEEAYRHLEGCGFAEWLLLECGFTEAPGVLVIVRDDGVDDEGVTP